MWRKKTHTHTQTYTHRHSNNNRNKRTERKKQINISHIDQFNGYKIAIRKIKFRSVFLPDFFFFFGFGSIRFDSFRFISHQFCEHFVIGLILSLFSRLLLILPFRPRVSSASCYTTCEYYIYILFVLCC